MLDAMTRTMNEHCWLIFRGFTKCRIEFSGSATRRVFWGRSEKFN